MMGSGMLLFFIVPFAILSSLITGTGELAGVDINALLGSLDLESFRNSFMAIEYIIEMFYQMFN